MQEYVYEFRDQVSGPHEKSLCEKDLQGFSALLAETEGWLYEESEDEAKQVHVEKLEDLKKLGTPVEMHYQEAEEQPRQEQELGHRLRYYATIAGEFRNKDEKYIYIDEMEMMEVEKCVGEVVEWMNKAVSA